MRIFEAIEATANGAVRGNQTWHRNLYEPLVDQGHDVVLFSVEEGRLAMQKRDEAGRKAFGAKLLDTFRREHARKPFQLFFAYLMDGMVEPEMIDEIRAAGVIATNFSCNNTHQFDLVDTISPHFDLNLHSEGDAGEKFRAIGARPFWWPMSSNPKYFKPMDVPRDVAVSFVGASYGLRSRYVAHLLEHGVDVQAFGPGWRWGARTPFRATAAHYVHLWRALTATTPRARASASAILADLDFRRELAARFPNNVHDPVSDDDLVRLYSRSAISLGVLEVHEHHDPSRPVARHLHLREFEAPMSGALYVTGYMPELETMFEPDREVVTYRNEAELLAKVTRLLREPAEAEAIRVAGRKRALAEHTPQVRFEKLFGELGLG